MPHIKPLKLKEKKAIFCRVCRCCTFPDTSPSPCKNSPKKHRIGVVFIASRSL
nr:MAG TPA: hypothetical protein [Caudoviricetes sp.]